jgi:hypothetical protein
MGEGREPLPTALAVERCEALLPWEASRQGQARRGGGAESDTPSQGSQRVRAGRRGGWVGGWLAGWVGGWLGGWLGGWVTDLCGQAKPPIPMASGAARRRVGHLEVGLCEVVPEKPGEQLLDFRVPAWFEREGDRGGSQQALTRQRLRGEAQGCC